MIYQMACKKGKTLRCSLVMLPNDSMRVLVAITVGIILGFFVGVLFHSLQSTKLVITSTLFRDSTILGNEISSNSARKGEDSHPSSMNTWISSSGIQTKKEISKIWVPSNPKGAERLPPNIVASESDFYFRRLWGLPSEDLTKKPNYLVTFTVGHRQKKSIDAAVKKFSDNFTVVLFHYDGQTTEWDEFEWSKRAIHVSASKQTKWWFAKRFLHPNIVAPYDFIFIWDEDLGVENFNAEEYIQLVRKHRLDISQPGLDPTRRANWEMTKRQDDHEVHKTVNEKPGRCSHSHSPPCAAFVEIMAPVFSRNAWRCVWHMIQNDLVHGWGLDLALRRCVEPAHERIGVVDAQWIVHKKIPSLGNQGLAEDGKAAWKGVRSRCSREWKMFRMRMKNAEKAYYKSMGFNPSNFTRQI